MKLLFDFLPIVAFFVTYKFYGIYFATFSAIAISIIQVLIQYYRKQTIPTSQWLSLFLLIIFGGLSILLQNELLIKWKPTVLNWGFALAFLGSQIFMDKSFIQRMLENRIALSSKGWLYLNGMWIGFFTLVGIANLYVAYNFATNIWVNFKLFGILGITILFGLLQMVFLYKFTKLPQ